MNFKNFQYTIAASNKPLEILNYISTEYIGPQVIILVNRWGLKYFNVFHKYRMSALWDEICADQEKINAQIGDVSDSEEPTRLRSIATDLDPKICSSGLYYSLCIYIYMHVIHTHPYAF